MNKEKNDFKNLKTLLLISLLICTIVSGVLGFISSNEQTEFNKWIYNNHSQAIKGVQDIPGFPGQKYLDLESTSDLVSYIATGVVLFFGLILVGFGFKYSSSKSGNKFSKWPYIVILIFGIIAIGASGLYLLQDLGASKRVPETYPLRDEIVKHFDDTMGTWETLLIISTVFTILKVITSIWLIVVIQKEKSQGDIDYSQQIRNAAQAPNINQQPINISPQPNKKDNPKNDLP